VISLAMIVRNEAARLAACLASAADAVDEMVVLDTGSTDGSQALARAHGARVVQGEWHEDFAAARNEALALAGGDWVLVLDADERLATGQGPRVRALVASGQADGYNCRLVSALPPDQPSPVIAHWYCRLFRKQSGVAFAGRVHEQVAPSIVAAGGRIMQSDLTILHEGYAETSPAKIERNLALLRREASERPDDAFVRLSLGLTLASAGDFAGASAAFEHALVLPRPALSPHLRAVAWMKLGEARMREGAWKAAAQAAEQALAAQPDLALARYTLGRALFEQGAFQAAELLFDELSDAPADALGMTLQPRLIAVARALVRLRQRRGAEAVTLLAPIASDDPTGETLVHLGNAYLTLGQLADAVAAYQTARERGVKDADLERRLALCRRVSTGPAPVAAGLAAAGRP
jgi:tetratricopeptide (TPR) repeat protein